MKKEYIIVFGIIIIIIISHIATQRYLKVLIEELKEDLYALEYSLLSKNYNKEDSEIIAGRIQDEFEKKYDILAIYIDHDELEKIKTQLITINTGIKVDDVEDTAIEIEKCIFIMEHIKNKDSLKLVNIF